MIQDAEQALHAVRELKRLGVRIVLDDFGTGYSSLGYLRRYPFDKIKIDRSFVHTIVDDVGTQAIVTAILAMSRSLGLEITAEGVETPEQLEILRTNRCDTVQGYLLGRPMPAEASIAFGRGDAGSRAA